MQQKPGRGRWLLSIGAAALAFAVLTVFAIVILEGIAERDRLEARNAVERTLSILLAGLRDHEDFGSAIESSSQLSGEIIGVAAYAEGGQRLYSWGSTPQSFSQALPQQDASPFGPRLYIDKAGNSSIVLLSRPFHPGPPPPASGQRQAFDGRQVSGRERPPATGFLFTTLRNADIMYLEIREPAYWRNRRLEIILFPLIEVSLAAVIFLVYSLFRRNAQYRSRIEEQKSLVLLGTAASTLAHEIKNPLSSIRLQTRLLEKTCLPAAGREIGIINDEVERLSALSMRVGDYLREPAGQPRSIDPAELAREVGMRLCGRNIFRREGRASPRVLMDPERLRSVLENLLRNAIEAGGPEEALAIDVSSEGGAVKIELLDRGSGLSEETAPRLFDPFFTTKSRGTGIGLSICRRFVGAVGGTVTLRARSGGGCCATVLLPEHKDGTS
ncbi:MAG TPA: HAMP domain-containing sensor histidine kinase [Rectinemataceae bacterium]|nr:HAMP domain-containing sensor histidine kinase [Rectinemataceae bacterium]